MRIGGGGGVGGGGGEVGEGGWGRGEFVQSAEIW